MDDSQPTDWRDIGGVPTAWFDTPVMRTGAELISRIAALVPADHFPYVDLRPGGIRLRLASPTRSSPGDVDPADIISATARELGLTADPAHLQQVEVVIHSAQPASILSFWQAVSGYEHTGTCQRTGDSRLEDRWQRAVGLWLLRGDPQLTNGRVHVDVARTPEAVEAARATIGQEPAGPWGLALRDVDGNVVDLVPGDPLSADHATSDWQVVFGAAVAYPVQDRAVAAALVATAAALADDCDAEVLIDLRPAGVTFGSGKDRWEDGQGSVSSGFAELAAGIQSAARELGLAADPDGPRFLQLGILAADVPAVRTFWSAVLGYEQDDRESVTDIYDSRWLGPVLFFQQTDAGVSREPNRVHLELHVPAEQADARIATALAAGGTVVAEQGHDRRTLADPEGNLVDLVDLVTEAPPS